jgi:hypothetical protein
MNAETARNLDHHMMVIVNGVNTARIDFCSKDSVEIQYWSDSKMIHEAQYWNGFEMDKCNSTNVDLEGFDRVIKDSLSKDAPT